LKYWRRCAIPQRAGATSLKPLCSTLGGHSSSDFDSNKHTRCIVLSVGTKYCCRSVMPSADLDPDSSSAHCKSYSGHDHGTMPSQNPPLLGFASIGQGTPSSRSALAAERTASRKRSGSPARLDTITLGGTSHPALESTWSVNILFVIAQRGRVRHSQGWSQHMLPAPSMPQFTAPGRLRRAPGDAASCCCPRQSSVPR
jgi:hypothetical protein